MLISKFDLYKSEWLELVFDDRNKAYGAYELRQHNGRTMATAMSIAFLSVITAGVIIGAVIKPVVTHEPVQRLIPVVLSNYVYPAVIKPPKPIVQPKPISAKPAAAVNTKAYIPFVVSSKPPANDPPKTTDLKGAIGPLDVKVPGGAPGTTPGAPGGTGTSATPGNSNEPVSIAGLEVMPEPFGGAAAWAKFIQKHLKYPDMAVDNKMQGKVWVSFIVEKDGRLSNFMVDRGAGYGMDEEALRVLKLAPAWKPGIQNGQPVRVKYNIPINFILGDDDN